MSEILRALAPVVEALEALGHRYRVGGSVASSALGVPRSTLDVDIVCDLSVDGAERFASMLRERLPDQGYASSSLPTKSSAISLNRFVMR
jgi:hypothetical protein